MSPRPDVPEIPVELIDASKRTLRKVWAREDLNLCDPAFMVSWDRPAGDPALSEEDRKYLSAPTSERIRDAETDIRNQFITIRRDVEHMQAGEEIGTGIALFPALHLVHFGTGPLATAFGSRWVVRHNDQPFFEPAIHTPEEARRLRKPDLLHDGILPRIYERIEYFSEITQGKIPICVCDTAGPWSIATQIWHYEDMLQAILEAPDAVHHVMEIVTECMIEFTHMQVNRMARWSETTNTLPGFWHPRGAGIGDDTLVTVSPRTWEQFFLPYNNRISHEFGGAMYHCCMRYDTHFQSLIKTDGFIGFDPMPEFNDLDKIEAALSGRGVWVQKLGDVTKNAPANGRRNDVETIHRLRGKVGMFLGAHGANRQDAIDRAKRLLDSL